MNYEDGDSDEFSNYSNAWGNKFGAGFLSIESEFIQERRNIYESKFASSFFTPYLSGSLFSMLIERKNEDGSINPVNPRVGLISDPILISDLSNSKLTDLEIFSESSSDEVSSMSFLWFSKQLTNNENYDDYFYSLAYGNNENSGYEVQTDLINLYLKDVEKYLSNPRLIKSFILLNETDINQLDFTKPVYIDRYKSYFYISKIKNYRGSNQSTECELIKIP